MKHSFTIEQLKNSACAGRNQHLFEGFKKSTHKNNHKGAKAKAWLLLNLQYWCNERSVTLDTEYKFHPYRKFRFDFAISAFMIAVEYEGGIFQQYEGGKSGHHTAKHYTKDTDKYNLAASLGWTVFRVTAINYKSIIEMLNNYMQSK